MWLRERDAGEEEEADAAQDVTSLTLAQGPLLLPTVRDPEHARYNCWQLANDSSWPELARLLLARQGAAPELAAALKAVEPARLPAEHKAALLAFLCNEAAACDKVHLATPPPRSLVLLCTPVHERLYTPRPRLQVQKALSGKLRQMDRILDKKRAEDAALLQASHRPLPLPLLRHRNAS